MEFILRLSVSLFLLRAALQIRLSVITRHSRLGADVEESSVDHQQILSDTRVSEERVVILRHVVLAVCDLEHTKFNGRVSKLLFLLWVGVCRWTDFSGKTLISPVWRRYVC